MLTPQVDTCGRSWSQQRTASQVSSGNAFDPFWNYAADIDNTHRDLTTGRREREGTCLLQWRVYYFSANRIQ